MKQSACDDENYRHNYLFSYHSVQCIGILAEWHRSVLLHTRKRPMLDILSLHTLSSQLLIVLNRSKGWHDGQLKVCLSRYCSIQFAEAVITYLKIPAPLLLTLIAPYLFYLRMSTKYVFRSYVFLRLVRN